PPRAAARARGAAGHRRPAAAGGAAGGPAVAGGDMSRTRPGRTPYWPDRSALRRRRSARRAFWVAVALVLVLPWFGYRHVRDWLRPEAGAPPVPVVADAASVPPVTRAQPSEARDPGPPLVAAPAGGDARPDPAESDPDAGIDAIG